MTGASASRDRLPYRSFIGRQPRLRPGRAMLA